MVEGKMIWSEIPDGTSVGVGTKIGRLCHIDRGVIIGNNVNIQGGVYIPPEVTIRDNVFIAPCVVFTNDRYPPSDRLVPTVVESGAIICANATIGPGLTIGENSVICQGANVVKSVSPNTVVAGNPAKYMMSREEYDLKQAEYTGRTDRYWQLGNEPQEDTPRA